MFNKKVNIHILPHDRLIKTRSGISLMEALIGKSIFLRSDCGGRGVCGKCIIKKKLKNGNYEIQNACSFEISEDISIEIPESSLQSSHIMSKASLSFPEIFNRRFKNQGSDNCYGIATDIGTTTIAIYLCNMTEGKVLSSIAIKNPQALYGDDVMSRIGAIGLEEKNLGHLQGLVIKAIEWGIKKLLKASNLDDSIISQMTAVGNPTMIHILAGVNPESIGMSPYQPAFYEARNIESEDLCFTIKNVSIQLLPQVSGFIGGDILGAAIAVDLENQPEGTLLVDLGTNGELMLKGEGKLYATSCATGPAFEGASLSCGMQAIAGAINKVVIKNQKDLPEYTLIGQLNPSRAKSLTPEPSGICGTGVLSAVAQFCKNGIIEPGGLFNKRDNIPALQKDDTGKVQYILAPSDNEDNSNAVYISQKDIRSVQLGKAALITGIEFLLKEAGLEKPEKIIIAGAFGSFLDKNDMITLGMIPALDQDKVIIAGNSAGAGAVMVLCDNTFLEKSIQMADKITVVELAANQDFQNMFIQQLGF